jgi:hypothetical protein
MIVIILRTSYVTMYVTYFEILSSCLSLSQQCNRERMVKVFLISSYIFYDRKNIVLEIVEHDLRKYFEAGIIVCIIARCLMSSNVILYMLAVRW